MDLMEWKAHLKKQCICLPNVVDFLRAFSFHLERKLEFTVFEIVNQ